MTKYMQVYTGDGKGKTTASLGVVLRTLGAGGRVLFAQFAKSGEFSEHKALSAFDSRLVTIQCGLEDFIYKTPTDKDIAEAVAGWKKIKESVRADRFDLIVLDELNIALYYKLLEMEEVLPSLLEMKKSAEVIVTGREALPEIIDAADLVTEMKEIKHYYSKNVPAREGIEF